MACTNVKIVMCKPLFKDVRRTKGTFMVSFDGELNGSSSIKWSNILLGTFLFVAKLISILLSIALTSTT